MVEVSGADELAERRRRAGITWPRPQRPAGGEGAVGREITCAFCRDGYFQYKGLTCPACSGRETVRVSEPAVRCISCRGSGKYRRLRMTCSACGGKGMVTVPDASERCPACNGRGRTGGPLPCTNCGGTGLVRKRTEVPPSLEKVG